MLARTPSAAPCLLTVLPVPPLPAGSGMLVPVRLPQQSLVAALTVAGHAGVARVVRVAPPVHCRKTAEGLDGAFSLKRARVSYLVVVFASHCFDAQVRQPASQETLDAVRASVALAAVGGLLRPSCILSLFSMRPERIHQPAPVEKRVKGGTKVRSSERDRGDNGKRDLCI